MKHLEDSIDFFEESKEVKRNLTLQLMVKLLAGRALTLVEAENDNEKAGITGKKFSKFSQDELASLRREAIKKLRTEVGEAIRYMIN